MGLGQARMIGRRGIPSTEVDDKPKGFDDYELRLGDMMRGERATLSKSLLDVQRELKIKASYIAAIENCDPSAFETPGFVAGYVRSYARYLGMDPDWAFQKFCRESNFEVAHGMSAAASGPKLAMRPVEYEHPLANPNAVFVPRGESFLSSVEPRAIGSILVLTALVTGLGYGAWAVVQEVQKVTVAPIEQAPGIVAELDPLSTAQAQLAAQAADETSPQAVVTSEAAPVTPEAFDRLYRPEALDVPVIVARDGPIAAIDPRTVGTFSDVGAAADAAVTAALQTPELGSTPVQVVEDVPELELLAVRPAWVRVTAPDGTVVFEKILDAGERYSIAASDEPPVLRVGESGALYFAVNGETYGPAGADGSVTKNLVLAPEALTAAYAVADMTEDADLARFVSVAQVEPADLGAPAGPLPTE